jgi:predicted Zn-dependent peptidase
VKNLIAESHDVASDLQPLTKIRSPKVRTDAPKVIVAPYDAHQFNYTQYTNRGEKFELADEPAITLYNEYFGSGMNTIVFQEMREARALAYSAGARLSEPTYKDDDYFFYARIGSQNDKLRDAVEAFDEIINNMPQSDRAFEIAKTALEGVLRTSRTNGSAVLNSWLAAQELGIDEPIDKLVYEKLPSLTMDDIVAIQQKYVKDRTYIYGILGDPADLDMNFLRTLGPVQNVTLEEVFGY